MFIFVSFEFIYACACALVVIIQVCSGIKTRSALRQLPSPSLLTTLPLHTAQFVFQVHCLALTSSQLSTPAACAVHVCSALPFPFRVALTRPIIHPSLHTQCMQCITFPPLFT